MAIKCFPKVFLKSHTKMIEMVDFQWMQKVLVYFYNTQSDEMFDFYDNRMKSRFNPIRRNCDAD